MAPTQSRRRGVQEMLTPVLFTAFIVISVYDREATWGSKGRAEWLILVE